MTDHRNLTAQERIHYLHHTIALMRVALKTATPEEAERIRRMIAQGEARIEELRREADNEAG